MALNSVGTATFGLSKDLTVPVSVKICYLQNGPKQVRLATLSEKYSEPSVFRKLSNVNATSEFYVQVQVYQENNPIANPVQTSYQPFTANRRLWNQWLQLPVYFNQLSLSAYMVLAIYEICDTSPSLVGVGTLPMFDTAECTLNKGTQKVSIRATLPAGGSGARCELSSSESNLIKYENGDYKPVPWLDKMVGPALTALQTNPQNLETDPDVLFNLYIELPRFDLPIVYSDITYDVPSAAAEARRFQPSVPPDSTNITINSIDISIPDSVNSMKIYDPDFQLEALTIDSDFNIPDPIEQKYQKLERNINNTILDKELKPSPEIRDELLRILQKPSNIEMTEMEKMLVWKFRYYYSKNNITSQDQTQGSKSSRSRKLFLIKFLKAVNWSNELELDQTFNEFVPNYWSVNDIDVGDALELLSNQFNPLALGATVSDTDDKHSDLSAKIFKYTTFLRRFAVSRLRLASADELLLYLLQLVQALKYELVEKDPLKSFDLDDFQTTDLGSSPLATFLIERAVENETLGNFFYWFVKVEHEDQLGRRNDENRTNIYTIVLNRYIGNLKKYSQVKKTRGYSNLKRQIWFIKKLTNLVELLRSTFKRNEATAKKAQFLRDYLSEPSNELKKFLHPFPLPLDPSVIICGCYPEESSVFKSSLAPLKLTFKTITNYHENSTSSSQIFGKNYKHGKYLLMFKIGDDLRQDQLVIQIMNLMDQLLKNENLDLRLTPYKILATSPIAGLIQFVPNQTLDSILAEGGPENGILQFLRAAQADSTTARPLPGSSVHAVTSDMGVPAPVMDNYVRSCAGYCVITYLLGVGDRHLDNLLLSSNGKFWHADFGYILGRDPKPFPPLMKLPIQVIEGMGGREHENFHIFQNYCFITYTTLRKSSNLILNLFQLMLDANIPDIRIDPLRAVEKVQEKFCLDMSEEEAILHFQNLINDSVNAFLPVVIDRLHSLAQYWRA